MKEHYYMIEFNDGTRIGSDAANIDEARNNACRMAKKKPCDIATLHLKKNNRLVRSLVENERRRSCV